MRPITKRVLSVLERNTIAVGSTAGKKNMKNGGR